MNATDTDDAESVNEETIRSLARAIRGADSTVALTGAGVSTASGVPDFRGSGGVWKCHDPRDFHLARFERDPAGFWTDRLALFETMYGDREIEPNAAHEALARLESVGELDALVTQNTDGLHGDAGSENVIELHGNGSRVVCRACGERTDADVARERVREGHTPPRCSCGGLYKPDVVLFGEDLPEGARSRSQALADNVDVFLVAGSSLTVEPAASLPRRAADSGATLSIVNLDPTSVSDRAPYDLRADLIDALPRVTEAVLEEN
ncbi:NAD-dependent protein deacetylase [Halobacteriales archaeon QS_3_64_16]|nr:MAG: NAD-dependent protein deacetylase [Halobacteriales archaeon QS_3_64_16]